MTILSWTSFPEEALLPGLQNKAATGKVMGFDRPITINIKLIY